MKRIIVLVLLISLLTACGKTGASMERALSMRKHIIESKECAFDIHITADYVDYFYEFKLKCKTDSSGDITFCVAEPNSISGISGKLSMSGGALTFEDKILAFPVIVDGLLSPVSAPWLLMNALRSGYIKGVAEQNNGLLLQIDDSFEGENIQLYVTTDSNDLPVSAEVIWQGNRIMAIRIENFHIL